MKTGKVKQYFNIDDLIFDNFSNIFDQIIESAKVRCETYHDVPYGAVEIPLAMKDKWKDKFEDCDVTKWKPKTDDRALPKTSYSNSLYHVVEYQAYEIRGEIMTYIINKWKKKTKEK